MKLIHFLQREFGFPRRKSFELIRDARVCVNGTPQTDLTFNLEGSGSITIDGKLEKYFHDDMKRKIITIPFYKPKGILCSHSDPHYDRTFFDILPNELKQIKPLYMVGRLDKDSHGLILLTNDGDLVNKLSHPSSHIEKEYIVTLDAPLQEGSIHQMATGVIIPEQEDLGKTKPAKITLLPDKKNTYSFILTEGRNRQIRRMCEMFGRTVIDLERIRIGNYQL